MSWELMCQAKWNGKWYCLRPSQSTDCSRWASCILEPEGNMSQAEWHKNQHWKFHLLEKRWGVLQLEWWWNWMCYERPSFYFSFSFPLLQTHRTLSLLFPFSLHRPWTSLCLPFCLMASIFRYDSLWLILQVILILRPSDFWWLILWVIPIFSSWLLWTMTHS